MRWLALLLIAACDLSPAPPAEPVRADAALPDPWASRPEPAADTTVIPAPAPPAPPQKPIDRNELTAPPQPGTAFPPAVHAVVAPPSQAMRALAVTADGTVAVSADVAGSVRLWPALDGTLEPVVLAMRRPVALAMLRNGNDLEIAGIDGAGQLEVLQVSALGQLAWRKWIDLPRPVVAVRATNSGFLIERDDQHLAFVDRIGNRIIGELEPPAGMHIAALATQGDSMFALLDGDGAVHGRWIEATTTLTWGQQTGALPVAARAFALSPDRKRLAAVDQDDTAAKLVIVGIEHGDQRLLSSVIDATLAPIAFVGADTVLVANSGETDLWHLADDTFAGLEGHAPAVAAGGTKIVIGEGADLMIANRDGEIGHLGFRMPNLWTFAPSAHSVLASDAQRVVRLGADLREHASYDLPQPRGRAGSPLAVLDSSHVLVETYTESQHLDVVAIDTMETTPIDDDTRLLAYDPATRLAAFARGNSVWFRRFDPNTATFGRGAELETRAGTSSVVFGDGGAFVTTVMGASYVTCTVTRIRPDRGTLVADRGREYSLDQGQPFVSPPPAPVMHTAKSPDGTLIATIGGGRMSLRDADGTRWTVPARGATDVVWMGSRELFALGEGFARVAIENGALDERRCGWEFGLWPQRLARSASTTICEAE
jgi:hypothetical protein